MDNINKADIMLWCGDYERALQEFKILSEEYLERKEEGLLEETVLKIKLSEHVLEKYSDKKLGAKFAEKELISDTLIKKTDQKFRNIKNFIDLREKEGERIFHFRDRINENRFFGIQEVEDKIVCRSYNRDFKEINIERLIEKLDSSTELPFKYQKIGNSFLYIWYARDYYSTQTIDYVKRRKMLEEVRDWERAKRLDFEILVTREGLAEANAFLDNEEDIANILVMLDRLID